MIDITQDIQPLTTFRNNSVKMIKQLKKTGRPIILTVNGKPEAIVEKMLTGKLSKFYEEFCLLEQPFIKDQTMSISQLIAAKVGKLGENIAVRRFARFKVGEATATVAFVISKPDDGGEATTPAAK